MIDTPAIGKATFANASNIASWDCGGGMIVGPVELSDGRVPEKPKTLWCCISAWIIFVRESTEKGLRSFYERRQ
jgi:hypothetical protein